MVRSDLKIFPNISLLAYAMLIDKRIERYANKIVNLRQESIYRFGWKRIALLSQLKRDRL